MTKRGHADPEVVKRSQDGCAFPNLTAGAVDHDLEHFVSLSNCHSTRGAQQGGEGLPELMGSAIWKSESAEMSDTVRKMSGTVRRRRSRKLTYLRVGKF